MYETRAYLECAYLPVRAHRTRATAAWRVGEEEEPWDSNEAAVVVHGRRQQSVDHLAMMKLEESADGRPVKLVP